MTIAHQGGRKRALAWAAQQTWAIERGALETLLQIAGREHVPDFDAVLARQGERLGRSDVQVRDGVAILEINGTIFRYANLFSQISGGTSIAMAALDLRAALDDPRVRTIVLNIDSPGGTVNGISDFAQLIRSASKHTVAFVGGAGNSAAYWIAAAAQEIVVSDTATLGSIGTIASVKLNDDDTLIEIVSSQSPDKARNPRTDEGRAVVQKVVDELARVFISAVADYRQVTTSKVMNDFGRGSVLVGRAAVAAGMADFVGTLEGVIASLSNGGHGPAYAELLARKEAIDNAPNVLPMRGRR